LSPLDVLEETALLSLLLALALSYVLDRLVLRRYRRHARRVLNDLQALEAQLQSGDASMDSTTARAALVKLEMRLTAASKRLISWRSSPVEHWIIGVHIDPLLYDYERAGAMTTRLLALISRQTDATAAV
jgi:hypothetical protein